jgi:DNA-binding response OmpR family regulator
MRLILVAVQEDAICLLYAEELIEDGYDVVTSSNPARFLQLVEAESPDLILLDIWMVENGNNTLCRDIRNRLNGIPIILTTTYTPCKQHLAYLGFDDIVMKSFNLAELKSKINRLQERLAPSQAETPQSHAGTRKTVTTEQMVLPSRAK